MEKGTWETIHWFAFFFVVGGLLLIMINNATQFGTLVGVATTAYTNVEKATKDFTVPSSKASA